MHRDAPRTRQCMATAEDSRVRRSDSKTRRYFESPPSVFVKSTPRAQSQHGPGFQPDKEIRPFGRVSCF